MTKQDQLEVLQRFHKICGKDSPSDELKDLYRQLVTEEYGEFCDPENDINEVKEALDLIIVAGGFLNACGINISDALAAVNESNMSKFVLEREVETQLEYFRSIGVPVEERPVEEGLFGIYRLSDGKLMKPTGYAKVDEAKEFWL